MNIGQYKGAKGLTLTSSLFKRCEDDVMKTNYYAMISGILDYRNFCLVIIRTDIEMQLLNRHELQFFLFSLTKLVRMVFP